MIKSNSLALNWAKELSQGLITVEQLKQNEIISTTNSESLNQIKETFDIRVPKIFLNEIKNGNEVLKKQFIPSTNELIFLPEELQDPIGDEVWTPVEGLTHRYPDRVLLKPTYLCAGYCRFCFRRYKVSHTEFNLKEEHYKKCLEYIQSNSQIEEVILTGGDPLTLTDKVLSKMIQDLSNIKHLKIIRFHTRVPSLLPSRVTSNLIELLKQSVKTIWIVTHMNHADEFNEETKKSLASFLDNGFPVLLQSVLLKGINDTQENLIRLFKTAIENRVKPYYLHYPDLAKGTNHFRMPLSDAINLFKSLRGKISGLCLPQFIVDIPGGKGKIEVNTHRAREIEKDVWEFESPLDGEWIRVLYPAFQDESF